MTDRPSPSSLDDYRFERKFRIAELSFAEVENHVRFNPGQFSPIHRERQVNNIYFDTSDFNYYLDSVEGRRQRLKIRLRWYGDDLFGSADAPVLELKIKHGSLGRKEHYAVSSFTLADADWANGVNQALETSQLPTRILHQVRAARPTLVNTYRRKYFLSGDGLCRATIDRQMRYYHPNPFHGSVNFVSEDTQHIVLELKYAHAEDSAASRSIANGFRFRVTKSSKYVTGVEKIYGI